ncbi:SMI1/KNR4 family protein [Alphaproteobacteria bacterium KMM 3653]|uniref:SMI1/KNR4 family protein n=1 Tax=Harenicola maris TaxID=2841044 RepID=A0AAP2G4E8_9RHOB|nr:SMI1/KNR4 family protein [Harenicola maris]
MSELKWRPEWQRKEPASIPFNADGSVTFKGPVGDVVLPKEYSDFLQISEGAALRDRGSWFAGRFDEGVALFEIEWLGTLRNAMMQTWGYYEVPEQEQHLLPPTYVFIGYAEPGPSDVVINVAQGDPDYGKVFVWTPVREPWMTGQNTRGLGLVADSFNDFMNGLAAKDEL